MRYLFLILICVVCTPLFAQKDQIWAGDTLFITSTNLKSVDAKMYFGIVADTSQHLTIEKVQKLPDNQYLSLQKNLQNLNSKYIHWAKIIIQNRTEGADVWSVQTWANFTEFYVQKPDSALRMRKGGTWRKKSEMENNFHHRSRISFHLKPQETLTVYVKIHQVDQFSISSRFNFSKDSQESSRLKQFLIERNLIQGIFQGMLWIMIVYNLLVFMSVRDRSYLYYAFYLAGAALYFSFRTGLISEYVIYEIPQVLPYIWLLSIVFTSLFYYLFTRAFFDTALNFPKLDRIIRIWIGCKIVITLFLFLSLLLFTNSKLQLDLGVILVPLEGIIGLYVLYILGKKAGKLATFFIIGNLSLLLSGLFYTITLNLSLNGLLVRDEDFFVLLLELGIVIEMVFFSLGLGQRMEINERDKRSAQEGLIVQLRENQLLQEKVNRELEEKVRERTFQLSEKNEEIVRQNEEIGLQKSLIEKKNHNITASITYAKRIQEAMLPKNEQIRQYLPDFFVFFRPRDIVSGDFYFVEKIDSTVVVAVADCTGHGVPGAFMSLIGNDLLNEIVSLGRTIEPDQILYQLHRRIRQALRQAQNEVRDGMDIAVCSINLVEAQIQFAGAKNPLVVVKNGNLEHYKGSLMPIGGFQKEEERIFAKQTINLEKGVETMLYLFTDGFQDQFGGENRQKFMLKNFKNLLLNMHTLPLEKQENTLLTTFENWKNKTDQIDDILVFGIRLLV